MTINEYQTITGTTVATGDVTRVTATITKTQSILETLLGFTLTAASVNNNEYDEIGISPIDCPCPNVNVDTLQAPDAVVYAYRMFSWNPKDKYIAIDPATAVHKIKLVKDGVTFRTLDPDQYRIDYKQGIVKFIERCDEWCFCQTLDCYCTQLAVDADWLWDGTPALPDDLAQVWAEMTTFYAVPDVKRKLKSETLGSHSYTLTNTPPEKEDNNMAVIKKYAGPNGSARPALTW